MNYPLISEYIEAIKSAEDNFEELSYLRPVLDNDGLPVMTSGNFAVVFKMKDEQSGKFYAVKCFTKEQEGRSEAYREIAKELKDVLSPYLISIRYLEKELFVDTDQTTETEFPVLLMDWVDGVTLDTFIRKNKNDKNKLELLSYRFYKLSKWLISQPFAHGDLKIDNILIRENGELVLVDYDGMYVPAMNGQKARELGSPDFRSPYRTKEDFSRDIDDFSIITILLSLCMIHINPKCLDKYGAQDRLVFSAKDYQDISHCKAYHSVSYLITNGTNYKLLLQLACENKSFSLSGKTYKLTRLRKPTKTTSAIPLPKTVGRTDNTVEDRNTELSNLAWEIEFCRHVVLSKDLVKENLESFINQSEGHIETEGVVPNDSFGDYLKSKDSTKWQAALLLHILTIIIAYWIYYSNPETIRWDEKWDYVGRGFGVGIIAWLFCCFDYIKRDGSLGNCLIACILFPITIYFAIYRCVVELINIFKS
jgi:serine/threonine protein kinase